MGISLLRVSAVGFMKDLLVLIFMSMPSGSPKLSPMLFAWVATKVRFLERI